MMAFPYYSGIFYPNTEKQIIVVDKSDIKITEFKISEMTCANCEEHVNHEVHKLNGIVHSIALYENENAIIEFDRTKTNETEIEKAINSTGYTVTDKKNLKVAYKDSKGKTRMAAKTTSEICEGIGKGENELSFMAENVDFHNITFE
jgi:copper chaperone CopZ